MSESDALLATFCRITALIGILTLAASFVAAKVVRLPAASPEPVPATAPADPQPARPI